MLFCVGLVAFDFVVKLLMSISNELEKLGIN